MAPQAAVLGPSASFALHRPAPPLHAAGVPTAIGILEGGLAAVPLPPQGADRSSAPVAAVGASFAVASLRTVRRRRRAAAAGVTRIRARGGAGAAEAVLEREEQEQKGLEGDSAGKEAEKAVEAEKQQAEKELKGLEGQIVDEEAMLAKSTFPIKPDALIRLCKEVLARGTGTQDDGEADLAEDFEFCAPVVGPIGKREYLEALRTFKIQDAFPDTNINYHFFRVDPFEPDRVWFQTRKMGTNTGEFMKKPATGKALVFPPEAYSLRFNEEGKVKEFTVGYPMDRRVGNTGGLGGAFGYFYGVGRPLPIPECKPYKRSWQFRLLGLIARVSKQIQGVKIEKK